MEFDVSSGAKNLVFMGVTTGLFGLNGVEAGALVTIGVEGATGARSATVIVYHQNRQLLCP